MTPVALNVALLAPVPLRYLISGQPVCVEQGRVAFGSRAWDVFRRLDELRKGLAVNAYLYASHASEIDRVTRWHARYVGQVESIAGAHPKGMQLRLPTTEANPGDNDGTWAIFWEVEDLREASPSERIVAGACTPFGRGNSYGKNFVPEGPLLVEHP